MFAGTGNLTRAVRRAGLLVEAPEDITSGDRKVLQEQYDVLSPSHFKHLVKLLKSGRVRWLHLAPPCSTMSSARRKDEYGYAAQLRSKHHPEGLPRERLMEAARQENPMASIQYLQATADQQQYRTKEADEIARRVAKLARIQCRLGH